MTTPLLRSCFVLAGLVTATGLWAQAPKLEIPAPSPAGVVKQRVGVTDIEIDYSRPSARGRKVFGGLVPFDEVWRTGANNATKLILSTPAKFNGTEVPAGKYELFTIPGRTEWTFIIHKDMSEWGAYTYDPKNDVARVTAKPEALAQSVESFAIGINDLRDESATLNLMWENTRVPLKITVDVVSLVVPQIEAAMASADAKKFYVPAAMFYLEHGIELPKALGWMDAAIAADPNAFYFVYRKALIQEKMGDKAGAIATARASIEGAKKAGGAVRDEYIRLNEALIERLQ
ncbi:MAG TPA: DUF2911 domain-containing protein [Candidatus Didemnitutus sp.]|jgi:hypothetical protein